jgi:GAF domain-containing protein
MTMPPGVSLSAAGGRLLDDLATQAGLALRNAQLRADLQQRIDTLVAQTVELRAARQERIVAAQQETRRRLPRDVRDAPDRQLAAVAAGLDEIDGLLDRGDSEQASVRAASAARGHQRGSRAATSPGRRNLPCPSRGERVAAGARRAPAGPAPRCPAGDRHGKPQLSAGGGVCGLLLLHGSAARQRPAPDGRGHRAPRHRRRRRSPGHGDGTRGRRPPPRPGPTSKP